MVMKCFIRAGMLSDQILIVKRVILREKNVSTDFTDLFANANLWEKVFFGPHSITRQTEVLILRFGHYVKLAPKLGVLPGGLF